MIALLIIVLALAGLIISCYFTLAYYGRIKKAHWVPEILCARDGSSCVTVVQTPYARVFAVPNSLLGLVYYLALLLWILGDMANWTATQLTHFGFVGSVEVSIGAMQLHFSGLAHPILLLASIGTVVLGFYLIYALHRILRINCPLCYTAHAINAALLILLLLQAR